MNDDRGGDLDASGECTLHETIRRGAAQQEHDSPSFNPNRQPTVRRDAHDNTLQDLSRQALRFQLMPRLSRPRPKQHARPVCLRAVTQR